MAADVIKAPLNKALESLDPNLARVFIPFAVRKPRYFISFLRLFRAHRKARDVRRDAEAMGIKVPPFIIMSVTSLCNLACAGCYAKAASILKKDGDSGGDGRRELGLDGWRSVIREACSLGVVGFVIAGGEPFMLRGILDMCAEFSDRLFIIVTNGTAVSDEDFRRLSASSNVAVLVSIEGDRQSTDGRRGEGVYESAMKTVGRLRRTGVPFGICTTVTTQNYDYWMDDANIDRLISSGARIGIFIEYIPVSPGACKRDVMLGDVQRARFRSNILRLREEKGMYIIHSPGDEEFFGGCVSAGKGFVHITPSGSLTACPVSDVSVGSVVDSGLGECLKSRLFSYIRDNHELLETGDSPCALFGKSRELREIAARL